MPQPNLEHTPEGDLEYNKKIATSPFDALDLLEYGGLGVAGLWGIGAACGYAIFHMSAPRASLYSVLNPDLIVSTNPRPISASQIATLERAIATSAELGLSAQIPIAFAGAALASLATQLKFDKEHPDIALDAIKGAASGPLP